jgi:hypothetical protein
MTRSTSDVAVSRPNASSRSRVRRAISVSWLIVLLATAFADLGRFGVALWRPALPDLPPILARRFIALPSG